MQSEEQYPELIQTRGVVQPIRVYIPATVVYRGISFIRGLLLAWLLSSRMGQYSLLTIALQVINILAPLVSLGLNEAITRYTPFYYQRRSLKRFLKSSVSLILGITFVCCLALFIFYRPLGRVFFSNTQIALDESYELAQAVVITVFAIVAYFLIASVLKGLRMFVLLSVCELLHGVLFLLAAVLSMLYVERTAQIVIWCYVFSLVVPSAIFGAILISKLSVLDDREQLELTGVGLASKLISFGFWAAISGIIWQSWQIYSLWFLTKFCDPSAGDTFAAGRLISQLIVIVGIAMSIVVMTSVCIKWEEGNREQANFLYDLYTKTIFLGLLFAGLLIVNLRQYLSYLFPERFSLLSEILPQLVLFFHLATVLSFLAIHFVLIEKTRLMLWSWLAGLVCNAILAIFWIKGTEALSGAAYSACLSAVSPVIIAIVLILAEGQPISFGLLVIILSSVVLVLPGYIGMLVYFCLILYAAIGDDLFTAKQKRIIKKKLLFSGL